MPVPFAELCAKSNFSFLEGASHPEELVAASRELELDAIGICDRDGIYGLVRAYRETKERGGKLIAGAELTLANPQGTPFSGGWGPSPTSVTLLVRDHTGYQSLCRLLTRAHEGQEKGVARLAPAQLAAQADGLELVLGLDDDLLHAEEVQRGAPPDLSALRDVLEAFGGRVHVAAQRALDGLDARRTALAERLAAAASARVFATSRALFHHGSRRVLADVVHCIRHKLTLDEAGRALAPNGEARLRSGAQMLRLFHDRPAWVERAAEVGAGLTFSFAELRYRFPTGELCAPGETPDETLRRLTAEGLARRYGDAVPPSVRAQCDKELALIERLGVAPYFISVYDVVQIARRRRILCQGRGSAANSAVCFALGVTAVDPARSNLLFERFLSAERAEPPDIDVDFEHERREEVIQELYEKYGRDRAAMVCEVISYRGRSALREVGKVFGLSSDQLDRLSSLVLRYDLRDVSEKLVRETGLDPRDARLAKAVQVARQMEGFPRHLSIHVGGFVLSAEPLHHVAPVEPARMPGRTVIPWDKDDMDTLGFFKIDVLGLGMLTCVRKSLALLHELGLGFGEHRQPGQGCGAPALPFDPLRFTPGAYEAPGPEPFDPIEALARIPAEDPVVYDMICKADTVGVFQIESRAQMSMLPRLRPRCFYDLVIEVAIVRPGPIQGGMVHPYLRRRNGEEPSRPPHPILGPTLERTLGVPLFQEQVMQIAMVGAGYTPGEADQLRRDMAAWKKHGRLERHRERLLEGFGANGIAQAFGEALFKQIQGFGEYGFPESHAASFALIVYASCWLKAHHPAVFACALLNAQPMGFYSPSSIVQDVQRHGVEVRGPCIALSRWDNTLEGEVRALRLGFRQVKGIGEDAGRAIEAARSEAPFASVGDLARRAGLKKNEVAALAEAGALEPIEPGRRNAMWRAHAPRLEGLFATRDLETAASAPRLPPLRAMEQLLLDYGRMGLSVDDHPLRHVRPTLDTRRGPRVLRAIDLRKLPDRAHVRVAGLVVGRQRPQTASGVTFVSLEDETGVTNLVLMPDTFDAHRHAILNAKIAVVDGRLEREGEVIHVKVARWERVELDGGRELASRSRDFH